MNALLLFGRILFGGMFLYNGVHHFTRLEGMTQYAASRGVPSPELAVIVSGAMIIAGGASVLLGLWPRLGLLLIFLFLVPVSLKMHAFWTLSDPAARAMEMVQFVKNVGLTGAALGLMAVPVPWRFSVGAGQGKRRPLSSRGSYRPIPDV